MIVGLIKFSVLFHNMHNAINIGQSGMGQKHLDMKKMLELNYGKHLLSDK